MKIKKNKTYISKLYTIKYRDNTTIVEEYHTNWFRHIISYLGFFPYSKRILHKIDGNPYNL